MYARHEERTSCTPGMLRGPRALQVCERKITTSLIAFLGVFVLSGFFGGVCLLP